MEGLSSQIPWYFRPLPVVLIYVLGLAGSLYVYATSAPTPNVIAALSTLLFSLFYAVWPFLLYTYLAPHAGPKSRHRIGRCNTVFFSLVSVLIAGLLLDIFGFNTIKSNEAADLIVFPYFLLYLTLIWRTSDLLTELECRKPVGYEGRVMPTFIGMYFLPITIGWFYSRLKKLQTG